MKTKLFYLVFLLTVFLGKAQVNISEGFESGALPAGWITSGFQFGNNSALSYTGTGYAVTVSYTGSNTVLKTHNQISDGNAIDVSVMIRKNPGAVTYFGLGYELNNSTNLVMIPGASESLGSDFSPYHSLSGIIPAGTIPAGTTVKFVIFAMGQGGINSDLLFDDFKALQSSSVTSFPMEYTFDNTRENTIGLNPFTILNTSFVNDRNNNAEKAMQIAASSGSTANMTIIPKGNYPRTVSLWYKTASNGGYPGVFSYGTAAANQMFGLYLGPNGNPVFQAHSTDKDFGGTFAANTWHHVAITYDGTFVKMYMNGSLLGSQPFSLNTGNSSVFKIGNASHILMVDDLKIYGTALTAQEIENLYNYNNTTLPVPVISNISTSGVTTNSATVNYSLNAMGNNTTSVVKYGLANNALTNQITGFSATGNTVISDNVQITGLAPNTQYFYQIEATNSHGTASSSVGSFTTNPVAVAGLIAEYNFNNTYNNVNGNSPFASNGGTSFVADRNGNLNSAININNTGTYATIPNLPYGNSSRTIAFWAKANVLNGDYNMTFSYGSIGTGLANGGSFNNGYVEYFGYIDNFYAAVTHTANTWYHFVYTYDGTTAKIYRNGVLAGQSSKNWNTINNNDLFRLGIGVGNEYAFNGAIDDLKIYNYVLSDSEVANLYDNNSTLTVTDFSKTQSAEVYPNPVKDILNIKTSGTVKSVEIFNTSGSKVKEGKSTNIDMKQLPAGMYMVKITDSEGKTTTKKVIKN